MGVALKQNRLSPKCKESVVAIAKAYATAKVAAKDAEIARLQIEVENLKSYQQSLECDNFHANAHADTFEAEIDRLNFQLSEANRVLDAGRDRITALKADNARLREGIAKEAKIQRDVLRCEIDEGMHSPPKRIRECVAEDLEKLLSPADGDGVDEIKPKWMLNPCRECGAVDVRFLFGVNQRIQCIHCGLECSHPSSIDAAMLIWNTRAGRGIEG